MKMFPHPTPSSQPDIPLIDNPFSPEILATAVSGLAVINGIVTITLESARCDHSKAHPGLERVVVGRIALTIPAAQALLTGMFDFLGQHEINPMISNGAGGKATCQ
ncbi:MULTISPECIES: hypothetical protein [unclassified Sphingomonas]|uniref:hypothetical protein n=1 Tax=unclassified Sphingomonas TaxID=196159 RepID=UPI00226A33FF|nr:MULTISPECIES: hypothetical protein [unclassified Sphingomonas]